MSYIGREPQIGNFQVCDAISTVNAQAAYTMQVGGVNVSPESANHMIVSLNGVIQKPTDAFTVSGSTITFASNLVTGDVINFIQILGNVLDLGVPSDNTVTLAKLASGTDGNLISYDTSGNPVAVATGNDGQVLTSAGAGAPPVFETLPSGGIEMAQQWRVTTSFTGTAEPIASNWEQGDTNGYGGIGSTMSQSSGVFTFPSTGIYLITFSCSVSFNGDARYVSTGIETTTDNSSYANASYVYSFIQQTNSGVTFNNATCSFMFDVTNTTTHKTRFKFIPFSESVTFIGSTSQNMSYVTFLKLGDT